MVNPILTVAFHLWLAVAGRGSLWLAAAGCVPAAGRGWLWLAAAVLASRKPFCNGMVIVIMGKMGKLGK